MASLEVRHGLPEPPSPTEFPSFSWYRVSRFKVPGGTRAHNLRIRVVTLTKDGNVLRHRYLRFGIPRGGRPCRARGRIWEWPPDARPKPGGRTRTSWRALLTCCRKAPSALLVRSLTVRNFQRKTLGKVPSVSIEIHHDFPNLLHGKFLTGFLAADNGAPGLPPGGSPCRARGRRCMRCTVLVREGADHGPGFPAREWCGYRFL